MSTHTINHFLFIFNRKACHNKPIDPLSICQGGRNDKKYMTFYKAKSLIVDDEKYLTSQNNWVISCLVMFAN